MIDPLPSDGIPAALLELQRREETQFILRKTQEREAIALRGARPLPFVLPARPCRLTRFLIRFVPALSRAWQRRVLEKSGLFDREWYLSTYPDVRTAGVDPLAHFLRWGSHDRRDPGPRFSTRHYLSLYPDVAASDMTPVIHYLLAGWQEGRSIHPLMPDGRG